MKARLPRGARPNPSIRLTSRISSAGLSGQLPQLRPHCLRRFIQLEPRRVVRGYASADQTNKEKPRGTAGLKLNERYQDKRPDREGPTHHACRRLSHWVAIAPWAYPF